MHFIYNSRFDTCWDIRINTEIDGAILTNYEQLFLPVS